METQTLGKFVQEEMRRRGMSIRQFAEFVGVNHAVIGKFRYHGIRLIHSKKPIGEPSLLFLAKLAKATSVDLCSLVALIHPDATEARARIGILSARISQLPPEKIELLDTFLKGLALDNIKGGSDDIIEVVKRPD